MYDHAQNGVQCYCVFGSVYVFEIVVYNLYLGSEIHSLSEPSSYGYKTR